jgi:hypothetical protein
MGQFRSINLCNLRCTAMQVSTPQPVKPVGAAVILLPAQKLARCLEQSLLDI